MKKEFTVLIIVVVIFLGVYVLTSSTREELRPLPCVERGGPYIDGGRWFCAVKDMSQDVNEHERIMCSLNTHCDDEVCLVPLGTFLCSTYNPADYDEFP